MISERIPPPKKQRPLTVTELTWGIKRLLETQVGEVEVEGEIGNWTLSARGHAYFSLKDAGALLSCVFFNIDRARLGFKPSEGTQVVARGRISVYEARGQYQMIVSALEEAGLGDLFQKFLALKEKLEKEGLFAPERKRPLPALPRRIGVVTSETGAALRDIIHVIRRRFPRVEIIVSPCMVQGAEAPREIVQALHRINRFSSAQPEGKRVDVAILGRGGGSMEDLWAFNDEGVARAIAASNIPLVSAVGHETDFTIADFVADVRAATPMAAAEMVVGELSVVEKNLARLGDRLGRALAHQAETLRLTLQRLMGSWGLRQPLNLVRQAIQQLDELGNRSETALEQLLTASRHRSESLTGRLEALNPSAVLARGYSIVSRCRDGRIVTRENQARVADHLRIQLSEGELRALVAPKGEDFLDGMTGAE